MKEYLKKLIVYIGLIILALFVAGLYGAIHNQISYTVSPEYFTTFKFIQFGFTDVSIPERVRASLIGFLASWWMGFPIGIIAGLVGFIQRGYRKMFRISLEAMGIAVGFTLLFGLCGLLYGFIQTSSIDLTEYDWWSIPSDVTNLRRFLCAGYMHNSAYLGGVLSIPAAWTYQIVCRLRDQKVAEDDNEVRHYSKKVQV
jgi:hypothetical protein